MNKHLHFTKVEQQVYVESIGHNPVSYLAENSSSDSDVSSEDDEQGDLELDETMGNTDKKTKMLLDQSDQPSNKSSPGTYINSFCGSLVQETASYGRHNYSPRTA